MENILSQQSTGGLLCKSTYGLMASTQQNTAATLFNIGQVIDQRKDKYSVSRSAMDQRLNLAAHLHPFGTGLDDEKEPKT